MGLHRRRHCFRIHWRIIGACLYLPHRGILTMDIRQYLIEQYLDFKNNYLSIALFAEHRGMTEEQGLDLINLGRNLFNSKNIHS